MSFGNTGPAAAIARTAEEPIRVLVVDDSAVVRGLITRALEGEPDICVVSSASNGRMALNYVQRHPVEVVVLDIEMPVMNGLEALPKIIAARPGIKVIMASTLTRRGAAISIEALSKGAADFIPKPTASRDLMGGQNFGTELCEKVKNLGPVARAALGEPEPAAGRSGYSAEKARPAARKSLYGNSPIVLRQPSSVRPRIIAIGSSTGGPQALFKVIGELSKTVTLPILITQHMPATFTTILAEHLSTIAGRKVVEGEDFMEIKETGIYLAPGDFHMVIGTRASGEKVIRLNQDPQVNYCRPAVDPLLSTIAKEYSGAALTVILTGMGRDGLVGGREIIQFGGTIIAQDEASSVVWGMPGAVAVDGLCSAVLPLDHIPSHVQNLVLGARP